MPGRAGAMGALGELRRDAVEAELHHRAHGEEAVAPRLGLARAGGEQRQRQQRDERAAGPPHAPASRRARRRSMASIRRPAMSSP